MAHMNSPSGEQRSVGEHYVSIAGVLAPVVERWRFAFSLTVGLPAIAVVVALLLPRNFLARVTVATIANGPSISLGGAAALLSGAGIGAPQGGVQASPALVSNLMQSRRVLMAVGAMPAPGGGRIADRLKGSPVSEVNLEKVMHRKVSISVNRETGLVEVAVIARDSAVARQTAAAIIAVTGEAFSATTRAQASQLRIAQEARVDSASKRLTRAEEELMQFRGANRTFGQYSRQAMELQALERAQSVAQDVYMRAVADREGAVAKELEITPAIVVVDPAPATIPYQSRYLAFIAPIGVAAGWLFAIALILIGESMRRDGIERGTDVERLWRALDGLPGIGRLRNRPRAVGAST